MLELVEWVDTQICQLHYPRWHDEIKPLILTVVKLDECFYIDLGLCAP